MSRVIVKFLAITAVAWLASSASAAPAPPDAAAWLRAKNYARLERYYSEAQRRFASGKTSGDDLRIPFRAFYKTDADLAPKFDEWVLAYPKSYVARLARGIYYKRLGFEARGGAYIADTSQDRLDRMDDELGKAARDFGESIELEPKPFLSFLYSIDLGRNYASLERTRQLYDQAVALAPDSAAAREKMMWALQTRWGGSLQAMQQFLEQCRSAHLKDADWRQLQSMVFEDEGWVEENRNHDLAAAVSAYQKAIAVGWESCGECLYSSVVKLLVKLNRLPEAVPYLDKLIELKPDEASWYGYRGTALAQSGHPREALADLRKASEMGNEMGIRNLPVAEKLAGAR